MKIERMNKGEWGKVKAFFDVRTEEGFVIKGFKIIEGINGLFVSMPSQKGKNEEYFDTVWLDKDLRDHLNQFAINSYNDNTETLSPNANDNNIKTESNDPISESKEPPMVEANNSDTVQPFSEDDIPF